MAFFPYEFEPRYKVLWRFSGAREDVDGVTVGDGRFVATYGRKKVDTPLDNITGAHITRDYSWTKAIGIRASLADDGLTFGTCTRGGVCVHFDQRVPRVIGLRPHSAVTVTVEDLDGLVAALGFTPDGDRTPAGPPGEGSDDDGAASEPPER